MKIEDAGIGHSSAALDGLTMHPLISVSGLMLDFPAPQVCSENAADKIDFIVCRQMELKRENRDGGRGRRA